jgi:glycosyltransferase involved in cell wall biosynthesis
MAASLFTYGHIIEIISSRSDLKKTVDGIILNCFDGNNLTKRAKTELFIHKLSEFRPHVVICSEPLPIYAAHKYSKKQKEKVRVIYDITEWYPSKKNLYHYNHLVKWFIFIKLLAFNLWVSALADSFVFGEWYKSRPYRILFPGKPFIFTSYYPDLKYIKHSPPLIKEGLLRLSYSGRISLDKGFGSFKDTVNLLSKRLPELKIEVKIIGWQDTNCEKNVSDLVLQQKPNVTVTHYDRQTFLKYLCLIRDTDIFIDLRKNDFENGHCLPIKLFYYAAFQRPVIISDLKAIRKETDINEFGLMVNPGDTNEIVKRIMMYINNPDIYIKHSLAARRKVEQEYNWHCLESLFIDFVTS